MNQSNKNSDNDLARLSTKTPHIKSIIHSRNDINNIFQKVSEYYSHTKLSQKKYPIHILQNNNEKGLKSQLLNIKRKRREHIKTQEGDHGESSNIFESFFLPPRVYNYKLPKSYFINQSILVTDKRKKNTSNSLIVDCKKVKPLSLKYKNINEDSLKTTIEGDNNLETSKSGKLLNINISSSSNPEMKSGFRIDLMEIKSKKKSKLKEIISRKIQEIQTNNLVEKDLISYSSVLLKRTNPKKICIKYPQNHHKKYKYWLGPGNNHEIIHKVLQETRENYWVQTSQGDTLFNLKWQQYTQKPAYKYLQFNRYKQLINHLEFHQCISTKIGLVKTLQQYYTKYGQPNCLFDYIPITFTFDWENSNKFEEEVRKFVYFYCQNHPNKEITQKMERYLVEVLRNLYEDSKKLPNLTFNKNIFKKLNPIMKLNQCFKGNNEEYLWMIKPSQLNRGRGIELFSTLQEMCEIVKQNFSHDSFVIQKYIERPLLIENRKFDIRVWVLVSPEGNSYICQQGYIRTSSQIFSLNQSSKNNKYVHLTNNAVQKKSQKYGIYEDGNQLTFNHFDLALQKQRGYFKKVMFSQIRKICKTVIQIGLKKMIQGEDITKYSLHSQFIKETYRVKPQMSTINPQRNEDESVTEGSTSSSVPMKTFSQQNKLNIKGTFEIFGFDFMIDENEKVWLIEINTNPCLETSSKILQKIIPKMLNDAFKIVLDPFFPCKVKKGLYQVEGYSNEESLWLPLSQ